MRVAGQWIRIVTVCVTVFMGAASADSAVAAQYAAIVMDMRDGSVLYESNADRRQAPASLTKMMTLYLTFEAVQNGQLKLDQNVRISSHAARQPPSKLYLKAGQRVSVRSLIRAAAIKSANDAAVALAEAVGGSEAAFAQMMTAKARQFGMNNTTFRNASGLTASGHLSTARDMAVLGRHLFFDFPQYYNIFSRRTDHAAGKRIYSTNRRLLSSYRGADGIKTGYTRAAGYNLVASAHRGDKRVIAAIFGGSSSRWRNDRMVQLLDKGFAAADTRVAMVRPRGHKVATPEAPLPMAKPGAPATGLEALAQILTPPAVAAIPPSDSELAPLYAAIPVIRPGGASEVALEGTPGSVAEGSSADDPVGTVTDSEGRTIPIPMPRPAWAVHLGAFENRAVAIARVTEVTLGANELLASAAPVIDEIRGRDGALYRVRFVGLAPEDASRACQSLKKAGRDCVTVPPQPASAPDT